MIQEKWEKRILWISFFAGLLSVLAELSFSVYSHSQSTLIDAVYDASDLIFVALVLFLTPLFHKPISEKYPFGFFQVETLFILIKGIIMLSVTACLAVEVIDRALSGGNTVQGGQISAFQLSLTVVNIVIYFVLKKLRHSVVSPTVDAEVLGWKLDIIYSFGLSFAFFGSTFLEQGPFAFLSPYFDPLITVLVMLAMLPETLRMIRSAVRDIFLFSPHDAVLCDMKEKCSAILSKYNFSPVFFDITKTGRHLWIAVYIVSAGDCLSITDLEQSANAIRQTASSLFQSCTCELIPISGVSDTPSSGAFPKCTR